MRDVTISRLARMAHESERLAGPIVATTGLSACPPNDRIAQIASGAATRTELGHVGNCVPCSIRLRAVGGIPVRKRHVGAGMARGGALLAAAAVMVFSVFPISTPVASRSQATISAAGDAAWWGIPDALVRAVRSSEAECVRCDANCDGHVSASDLNAFLLALANPERYEVEYPDCDMTCSLDASCDGALDDDDIGPFVLFALSES